MKQLESRTVNIDGMTFYIRPFPAFKAANLFGQLVKTLTPVIGGILPLADSAAGGKNLFDLDLDEAAPAIVGAVSSLSGDKVEELLKQLLIDYQNVSELFCGDTQDMFLLAIEVVKLNYSGFFKKLASQFGEAFESLRSRMAASTAITAS